MRHLSGFGTLILLALGAPVLAAPSSQAPRKQTADDLFKVGQMAVGAKDLAGAEKTARRGLKEFPRDHGFHLLLGEVAFKQKKYADAFYEYQWEFYRTGPESVTGSKSVDRIKQLLGEDARGTEVNEIRVVLQAMAESSSAPQSAHDALVRVEKERGDRFVLSLLKAETLTHLEKYDEAAAIYRALLKQDPNFVPAYLQLAGVLKKSKKDGEAGKLIAKAREIDPNHWQLALDKSGSEPK